MKSTSLACLAAALLATPIVACAAPIAWTLDGKMFGGATAGGSFVYDTASATFSNIALTTSTGRTYTQFAGSPIGTGLVFLQAGVADGDATIALALNSISVGMLTDAGGVLRINTAANVRNFAEFNCTATAGCGLGNGGSVGNWVEGGVSTLTGAPVVDVPEPGGLALLGLAMAGIATVRQRRR